MTPTTTCETVTLGPTMPINPIEWSIGVWEAELHSDDEYNGFRTTLEGPQSRNDLEYHAIAAIEEAFRVKFDDIDSAYDWSWSFTPTTNEWVLPNGEQAFFLTFFQTYQVYGGPEEGGWWTSAGEPVRHIIVDSSDAGFALAAELRMTDFADDRWHTYGARVSTRPGEAYPETMPSHYE